MNGRHRAEGFDCTISCCDLKGWELSNEEFLCQCGVPNRVQNIVGGQSTEVKEYPWQVEINFNNWDSLQ